MWILMLRKVVLAMAGMRLLAGLIEVSAGLLMLRFGRVETAIRINAILGLIGPIVMLTVTGLGLVGLAGNISWVKTGSIILGALLILWGTT